LQTWRVRRASGPLAGDVKQRSSLEAPAPRPHNLRCDQWIDGCGAGADPYEDTVQRGFVTVPIALLVVVRFTSRAS